ncbi:MAG: hypothetical protein QF464_15645, partial [Myxococcota bacterium]|nr:hypothetical protein [Myxococcota bacterium]
SSCPDLVLGPRRGGVTMKKLMILMLSAALLATASVPTSAKKAKKKAATLEWDTWTVDASGQPAMCDREDMDALCWLKVQLVVREGSLRTFWWDLGVMQLPTFMLESWGPCKGKLKKKGLICGASNFDCGDGCYADVSVGRFAKGELIIERYEGCRGGEECYDEPKLLYKVAMGNMKVKAR